MICALPVTGYGARRVRRPPTGGRRSTTSTLRIGPALSGRRRAVSQPGVNPRPWTSLVSPVDASVARWYPVAGAGLGSACWVQPLRDQHFKVELGVDVPGSAGYLCQVRAVLSNLLRKGAPL